MRRELRLIDCFGIGVNGIVGSGIFLLPATVFRRAGGLSPLAWLVVGALCVLVALCFAEAAGRTSDSGGPYRYACDAFGPHVGFAVGWITLVSSVLAYAAVARGFAQHAAWLVGREGDRALEGAIVVLLVVALAWVNLQGVKPGARTGDAVGAVKLVALVAFALFGVLRLRPGVFAALPAPHAAEGAGVTAAAFAGLFAITGFEYVPVPAGETVDPRRTVGLAMVLSVLGATVLYMVLQTVAMGTVADLGESRTPLVDAARALGGPAAGMAMAVLALVSAFGFCSSSALVCPRYVESFARDRFLPAWLERRTARHDAPVAAIVACAVAVGVLSLCLDFTRLADTSNVAIVAQYTSTCVGVVVMRRRPGAEPSRFRLPFGYAIPAAAIVGCVLFLFSVALGEIWLTAGLLTGGMVVGAAMRRSRAAPAQN
jgi:basic amino acid/polyamine antiporter, APA family